MNRDLFVAVGTIACGFDALIAAADEAAFALGLSGFAQIGGSRVIPKRLAWARWLAPDELRRRMAQARVVIAHGGIGILGEAMRARRPIIVVPRRGRPSRSFPGDDQRLVVHRIAAHFPIRVCEDLRAFTAVLGEVLRAGHEVDYPLGSDVPHIVAGFLARTLRAHGG